MTDCSAAHHEQMLSEIWESAVPEHQCVLIEEISAGARRLEGQTVAKFLADHVPAVTLRPPHGLVPHASALSQRKRAPGHFGVPVAPPLTPMTPMTAMAREIYVVRLAQGFRTWLSGKLGGLVVEPLGTNVIHGRRVRPGGQSRGEVGQGGQGVSLAARKHGGVEAQVRSRNGPEEDVLDERSGVRKRTLVRTLADSATHDDANAFGSRSGGLSGMM
ncbi:hypothetical protein A1Q1_03557 [Trichosporon asahii var. asahii CBS 2479]|uniref:Uncharacterized protein n=1 Tax=Trichosporon asahii var. asahii (strain ATCC 90039 / CBS 2479 / JCM 2466 / KCTC 7840 / NBRC 103889/ NCYC 2677 / UAMH 7654) TaxID=1186058 RepID=J6ESS2_TRIAS|nr:hypothetical protein A1Q1_03557 [Trichosporon asahii var. asahii CBS 2479]EJT47584.1 hypothetical protein A1Q1_03557 [Trichosporon asahii var. asahii CBS 2479]